jgi:hypothetical protein
MESPIVDELHRRWELDTDSNPVDARRAEDREALSILGAEVQHWDWRECVYRRHPETGAFLYPSEESLWGTIHPADHPIVSQLAKRLTQLPLARGGKVFAPLTVGEHVDHLVMRQALELWGVPQGELVFYEDYPYAEQTDAVLAVLRDRQGWRVELVSLSEEALTAKARAFAQYRSQISTFYKSVEEIGQRLRAYAASIGEGAGYAERYWYRR